MFSNQGAWEVDWGVELDWQWQRGTTDKPELKGSG